MRKIFVLGVATILVTATPVLAQIVLEQATPPAPPKHYPPAQPKHYPPQTNPTPPPPRPQESRAERCRRNGVPVGQCVAPQ